MPQKRVAKLAMGESRMNSLFAFATAVATFSSSARYARRPFLTREARMAASTPLPETSPMTIATRPREREKKS